MKDFEIVTDADKWFKAYRQAKARMLEGGKFWGTLLFAGREFEFSDVEQCLDGLAFVSEDKKKRIFVTSPQNIAILMEMRNV